MTDLTPTEIEELPGLVERLPLIAAAMDEGRELYTEDAQAVRRASKALERLAAEVARLTGENAELRAERDAVLQEPLDLAKLDSIDDEEGVPDKMLALYWCRQAQIARKALSGGSDA